MVIIRRLQFFVSSDQVPRMAETLPSDSLRYVKGMLAQGLAYIKNAVTIVIYNEYGHE